MFIFIQIKMFKKRKLAVINKNTFQNSTPSANNHGPKGKYSLVHVDTPYVHPSHSNSSGKENLNARHHYYECAAPKQESTDIACGNSSSHDEEQEKAKRMKWDTSWQSMREEEPQKLEKIDSIEEAEIDAIISVNAMDDDQKYKDCNLFFATDYIEDIIAHELYKERHYRISDTYCKTDIVTPYRRTVLIDWLVLVQVEMRATNGTLHLAVALLDLLLDKVKLSVSKLQTAAAVCFWVAYKYLQGSLSGKKIVELCPGVATLGMILHYEVLLLRVSKAIKVGGEIYVFFNYLLYQLYGENFPSEIYYCGQYLLEIMLRDVTFVQTSSSEKAACALYSTLTLFNSPLRHQPITYKFSNLENVRSMRDHLLHTVKWMYRDKELKSMPIYQKYSKSRYCKISKHETIARAATF